MAGIGLSFPYYGIYNFDSAENTVTYNQGGEIGKAVSADIEISTSEDNNLYGNNAIAETDRQFTGGTITLGTTELSQEVSRAILGAVLQKLEAIEGVTDANVYELIYDNRQVTPYLGIGVIQKKKVDNAICWRAIVLCKVMFAVPSESFTTQGESIEWQTPEISGTIMRDDTANQTWKREATFTTEAQAQAYLRQRLGVGVNPQLGTLTVQSSAGATSGNTQLTVSPALAPSNHYVYQTGESVTLPTEYGESVAGGGWTAWDGVSEIPATSGNEVGVVEADWQDKAVAAGQAAAVVNGGA